MHDLTPAEAIRRGLVPHQIKDRNGDVVATVFVYPESHWAAVRAAKDARRLARRKPTTPSNPDFQLPRKRPE